MAPKGSRRARTRRPPPPTKQRRRRGRSAHHRKMPVQQAMAQVNPTSSSSITSACSDNDDHLPRSSSSTTTTTDVDFGGEKNIDISTPTTSIISCSTPKAQRFRIPEVETCPPAPKKPRVGLSCCSQRRRPIAFFAPPDIELFFFFALGGISV